MSLSFCSSKKKGTKEKGRRNRAEGELGEAKSQPSPFFPPATQGHIGATKKGKVRTFSGLPPHLIALVLVFILKIFLYWEFIKFKSQLKYVIITSNSASYSPLCGAERGGRRGEFLSVGVVSSCRIKG
jgi:hypothetical protein